MCTLSGQSMLKSVEIDEGMQSSSPLYCCYQTSCNHELDEVEPES